MWWKRTEGRDESAFLREALFRRGALYAFIGLFAVMGFVFAQGRFADLYIWGRASQDSDSRFSVVTVGPEALRLWTLGEEPDVTPRDLLGLVVDYAAASGAKAVVLDFVLESQTYHDDALVEAAARFDGEVIVAGGWRSEGGREFIPAPAPPLHELPLGAANLSEELPLLSASTRIVRAAHVSRRLSVVRCDTPWPEILEADACALGSGDCAEVGVCHSLVERVPSLALQMAWLSLGQRDLSAHIRDCEAPCALPELGIDDLDDEIFINFRGPEQSGAFEVIPAAEVLHLDRQRRLLESLGTPSLSDTRFKDRVILVGRQTDDDRFATPYSFPHYRTADMSGLSIHANLASTLRGNPVRTASPLLFWLLGLVSVPAVWVTHRHLRAVLHFLVWLGAGVLLVLTGGVVFAWTDGLSWEVGPAVGSIGCSLIAVTLWEALQAPAAKR